MALLQDSQPAVRRNAAYAFSNLRPDIPAEAEAPMIAALKDSDGYVRQGAVFGVARFAVTDPEAAAALNQILIAPPDRELQLSAIHSIAIARVEDLAIANSLAQLLGSPDRRITIEALEAARALGPPGFKIMEPQIRAIARKKEDPEISGLAADLLSRGAR